jgi:6-pyruvoyltetrahydropterin/6-carboxytetrahydropterin synthase
MPKFQSTKTYGTDRGLSCCFRQWKANHSHCSTLHGYSLGFKFVFESETLDEKNWCFDFGGMKPIKAYLDYMFDHTILVAEDDPALETFKALASFSTKPEWDGIERGEVKAPFDAGKLSLNEPDTAFSEGRVCDLRIVPSVGCEMTAKLVYEKACEMLEAMKHGTLGRYSVNPDVKLVSVECFEHGSNSAVYYGDSDRKVFYVDVENFDADKAKEFLDQVKNTINGVSSVSQDIQQLETLIEAGADIEDLQYFTKKVARNLRIPTSK